MVDCLGSFTVPPDWRGKGFVSADGSTLVLDDYGRIRVIRRRDGPVRGAGPDEEVKEWPPGATVRSAPGVSRDRVIQVAGDGSSLLLSTRSASGLSVRSTVDGSEICGFGIIPTSPCNLRGVYRAEDDLVIGWWMEDLWSLRGGELTHVIFPCAACRVSCALPRGDSGVAYVHGRSLFLVGLRDGKVRDRKSLGFIDTSKRPVTSADAAGPTTVVTDGTTIEIVTARTDGSGTLGLPNLVFGAGRSSDRVAVSAKGDEWCTFGTSTGRVEVRRVWDRPELFRATVVPGLVGVRHVSGRWRTVRMTTDVPARFVMESLF